MTAVRAQTSSELVARARAGRRLPPPSLAAAIRRDCGVTQRELAEALGVDRVTVARWEIGEHVPRGEARLRYIEILEQLALVRREGRPDGGR
jgi:DNA-binding transcriptional regulator YiaG